MKEILTLIVMVLFLSCKNCKDETLTMQKESYTGSEIKLGGFYYSSFDSGNGISIITFFSNGTFVVSTETDASLSDVENDILSGQFDVSRSDYQPSWGLFQVSGNALTTEGWKIRPCGLVSTQLQGSIVNDSTIEIGNLLLKDNNVLTYKFKEFSPKPDSTNVFV